jgi:hypothetical protein
MRRTMLLWISLGVNVVLATALIRQAPLARSRRPPAPSLAPSSDAAKIYRTNIVVRRQNFVWNQIESADYPTFISNLRAIGCPEATIRDIIVADVNQLFARRRATEVVTSEQQWWRADPNPALDRDAAKALKALELDRRKLLSTLLGPDWESSYYPYPAAANNRPLDGPVLGLLSAQAKQAIYDIQSRSAEQMQEYLNEMQTAAKKPDPAELARLRLQMREELSQVLTPEQLEEYLLRYSESAASLRSQTRGIDTTPEEFRALFRTYDPIDQQLQLVAQSTEPDDIKRRAELEQQREEAFKQSLDPQRYEQYKFGEDPLYRDLQNQARAAGAPPEKIIPLYEVSRATDLESERIRNDTTLTSEQKLVALEAVRAAQQQSWRNLLGENYQRFLQNSKP